MSKFTDAVEAEARREGLKNSTYISPGFTTICPECRAAYDFCCEHSARYTIESGKFCEEAYFSYDPCDLCHSSLGGDRYSAHFFVDGDPRKEIIHIEVCVDCVLYLANGDEPETWGDE